MPKFLGRKPALWLGLVQTGIALVVGFGAQVSPEQVGLILAFVAAGLALVVNSQVTSRKDPRDRDGTRLPCADGTRRM